MLKTFALVAAVAAAAVTVDKATHAQDLQQQQSAASSGATMKGCPVAQRPTSSASSSSPFSSYSAPTPAAPHPVSSGALMQGCPVARRGSPTSSSSLSEPPDSPPHLASSSSSFEYASPPTLDAGLHPEGEAVPHGAIPAAGRGNSFDGSTWLNPSPNALFRALKRADKPIHATDAADVSAVHNAVTDNTWQCILEYEDAHRRRCPHPTLARFYGMDGVYSYKAQFVHRVLGGPLPFDRHDWVVDRCGTEVKYVIDYYSVEEPNEDGEVEVSYSIDARPAPTLTGIVDRSRMAWRKYRAGEKWW